MSKNKKGLGRGFDALFPEDLFTEQFDPTSEQDKGKLTEIKLSQIEPDKAQPRQNFNQAALEALAQSIKKHGVLQPIVLIKKGQKYQIVAGERRFRASKLAGKKTIPAIVRSLSDQHKLELSLIENLQREDLNPIEIATVYLKLKEQFNMTLKQIGQTVGGKSPASISNALGLLKLPKKAIDCLIDGTVTEGQVRTLAGLPDDVAKRILDQIIKHQWSARRVERVVANYRRSQDLKQAEAKTSQVQQILGADQKSTELTDKLSAKVKVKLARKKTGGVIEIKFKDQADFERISKQLLQ